MGNYKSQFESYYKNIRKRVGGDAPVRSSSLEDSISYKRKKSSKGIGFGGIIIFQLVGALVLIGGFLALKNIPLEGAKYLYNVSKEALSVELVKGEDIASAFSMTTFEELRDDLLGYIDELKSETTGEPTVKEKIKADFIAPLAGIGRPIKGEGKGVIITSSKKGNVLAAYDGQVSYLYEREGAYHIVIAHDNGIETYYGYIENPEVKVGEKVQVGQFLGNTTKITDKEEGVVFKIINMGVEKDPFEYMTLKGVEEKEIK